MRFPAIFALLLCVSVSSAQEVPTPASTAPTNAFADRSVGVLVKDADVLDVGLALAEVPMPAQPPNGQPGPR